MDAYFNVEILQNRELANYWMLISTLKYTKTESLQHSVMMIIIMVIAIVIMIVVTVVIMIILIIILMIFVC